MTSSVLPRPVRRAGTVFLWVLIGVLALTVLAAAWLGIRGFLAYQHLDDARASAARVASSLGDPDEAGAAIAAFADDTGTAHDLTSDPVWQAAELLPWIGPQLSAVGTVAAAADRVADGALVPLSDVAARFSAASLRPVDGVVDIEALAALQPVAAQASSVVSASAQSVAAIDTSALIGPVRGPIEDVATTLTDTSTGIDALSRATALLPAMLGADGPRDYLVVFQNNAEWRSLGGIVGAMATVHTDGGRMTLDRQGSTFGWKRFAEPVIPLTDEEQALFSNRPALWIQNPTQIPDFTVGAPLAREMWLRETGQDVAGVISADPVALSYLLEATGPVTLETGDVITAENAVALLLSDVYERYPDPRDQDAFFASASAAVFSAIAGGAADPDALLDGLARAGNEHRLFIWSADDAEQAILDGSTIQGGLPVTDTTTTRFGVFLNDATGAKIDYHVAAETGTTWCTGPNGADEALLAVSLRNTIAPGTQLPRYVTGSGIYDVAPGSAKTIAYIYLPTGSKVVSTTAEGGDGGFATGTHEGRDVIVWTTTLAESQEATASIRVEADRTARLEVRATPLASGPGTQDVTRLAPVCENAQ